MLIFHIFRWKVTATSHPPGKLAPEKGRKGCLQLDGLVDPIPQFFFTAPIHGNSRKKHVVSFRGCLILPICSMYVPYLPTKLGDFVRANVGKSSSTMEHLG